jgi:hypothetical protein
MSHKKITEEIADYVDGELSTPIKREVISKIKTDDDYSTTYEGILAYYKKYGHDRVKLDLYLIENDYKINAEGTLKFDESAIRLVSVFVGLLVIVILFVVLYLSSDFYKINNHLSERYPSPAVIEGEAPHRAKLAELYANNRYEDITELFANSTSKQLNNQDSFYLALSHLYSHSNIQIPRSLFGSLEMRESSFSEESRWFLALCYLKDQDERTAYKYLSRISKYPEHYKNKEAVELVD